MITNILEYKIVWVKSWGKSSDSAEGSLKNITYIDKVITQLKYPIEWGGLGNWQVKLTFEGEGFAKSTKSVCVLNQWPPLFVFKPNIS